MLRQYKKSVTKWAFQTSWGGVRFLSDAIDDLELQELQEGEQNLKLWLQKQGGFVHPSLKLETSTINPNSRGIIVSEDISYEDVKRQPLISIPKASFMNSVIAAEKLKEDGVEKLEVNYGAQAGELHMDSIFMLSLYLASEKNKGEYSEWYPWIRMLPAKPPCAWYMSDLELQDTLKQIKQADNSWLQVVQQSRQVVDFLCAQLMYNVKGKLQVQPYDIKWALGHVMSRGISPMQNIDDRLQFSSQKNGNDSLY
eukprot:TRINITY_DN30418_c0_g1_i1.p2 TRINITY_DN30418_c0_g1~~TRINITY_DN30418_c0_g1_i1.p2  ORF type:complete len:254 (-),score=27.64 TRINITY_DN30418_c0_g1_i1:407-1168(-)